MIFRLKRITFFITCMFLAIFISVFLIQGVYGSELNEDSRNKRTVLDSRLIKRGNIYSADAKLLAESVSEESDYKYQRVYYDSEIYSHITGYFSYSLQSTGIELYANSYLSGNTSSLALSNLLARFQGLQTAGNDIYLTIDSNAQKLAYEALGDKIGAAVVLEVKTGKIIAMASTPAYNANDLAQNDYSAALLAYQAAEEDSSSPLINKSIFETYAPGSTFKLVVAASAFENGYDENWAVDNPARYTLTGSITQIKNSGGSSCPPYASTSTLKEALQWSCNIPFAQFAKTLGAYALNATAISFGFNESLDIPLNVAKSYFPAGLDTAELELSGFGQANVAATPLQMAMVAATIANGGQRLQPQLIDKITDNNGNILQSYSVKVLNQAISASSAKLLTELMINNVENGAASSMQISSIKVAAKTGTAETDGSHYNLWLVGFAPADSPKYAIAVMVEAEDGFGGEVAAPVAKQILEGLL